MPARPLIVAIAIYVSLDLSNPFMPGAFIFDPEQSVEGLHGERGREQIITVAPPVAPRVETDEAPARSARRPAPMARRWLAEPRPAHVPAGEPPPPSDDH
jgi:hypothetical protein